MKNSALSRLGLTLVLLMVGNISNALSTQLPDGEILYYQETRQGKGELVVLDLKSAKQRVVGKSGSRADHYPSWSADGKKMVFESYRKGGWHVWVANGDGSEAQRLSNFPDYSTSHYEFDPSFAPDNQTAIFLRGNDLWTASLGDPTPQRLTPAGNGIVETAPVFSPDGGEIAMAGFDEKAKSWDIYLLSSEGNDFRKLTEGAGQNLSPQWSPDSKSLLFYSDRSGSFELYEMRRDGASPRAIFSEAERKAAGFQKTELVDPWDNDWGATEQYRASYSPDGEWIVFSRDVEGDRELFVARRDGSNIIRITHRKGLDGQPSWRPR